MARRSKASIPADAAGNPRPASIAELARRLSLSDWTVSRAINGHTEVSIKTRERVARAMEELGFRPNPLARGLRGHGTELIGICFNRLDTPIINQKVSYLLEFLRESRLRSLLEITLGEEENERRIIADFLRVRVEGMVFVHPALSWEEVSRLAGGVACVHVDPDVAMKSPSISLDRSLAMRMLLEHLCDLGHRDFAMIGIAKDDRWRARPLIKHARDFGIDPRRGFRFLGFPEEGMPPIEAGRLIALRLIKEGSLPTAFIAFNDLVAFGAIQALKDAGIDVPGRVSVTGFDHTDVGAQTRPRLTTIDHDARQMMKRAAAMLVEQIALPAAERGRASHEKVKPRLIIGESTAPIYRGRD